MMQHHLSIDIETKSSVDITKAGAYRYAQSEDFEILLFAYKYDEEDVQLVDLTAEESIPERILTALMNPNVVKHAYNAAFEWYCLNTAGYRTPLEQWNCTMIHGLYCGYTAGLDATGKAIGLPQDKQKLSTGKALIRYFCTPCKPTKSNGGRSWNLPKHAPEKWELFREYCKQDVVTENEILKRLQAFPVPKEEQRLWRMDILMNAYGVRVDTNLIAGALAIDSHSTECLTAEAFRITGLANPNSATQLQQWLSGKDVDVPNLQKATVEEYLQREDLPDDARKILEIRQQLGKTSIKKYVAMDTAKGADDRVRGLTQFYGANRTGRWAGRLVQLQNLPRNYLKTLDYARNLVKDKNYDGIKLLYGNVPDTLSQLIRTAFIPSDGNKFVVADFSAIEARVIAWLAGEQWVNEVFATHGKIYEATASQMFHVPIEKIAKGNPEYSLRQKGKVATLALGYQGGTAALIAMGALNMGLAEEELPDIVQRWRSANPRIRDLWYAVEQAALTTMQTAQPQGIYGLIFRYEGDLVYGQSFLTVQLPSGRKLFYPKPFLQENQFGKMAIHYYTVGQQTRKWEVASTYGGKMTENIVQAIARDCLAETLKRIDRMGLQVVFHVHDEVIIDAPVSITVDEICDLMAEPIPWAPGLILKGAGFESDYYMKD
ncbi:DNA polymerase [[Ruminococcus] gnavus]|uniref:DNA-directed DNA polymerase n=2 Tax=Mediterraneibacter gnavus TaxID=33038 RepID=A0AAJ3KM95_MEDGN|nr:DNA polymerase [Mediterraneibacter gnavus]NSC83531.1 DNA polymerase [Mediterraneibacter gnavus]NSI27621.1 DNA polymerase [Mediterraneibacter gnavus]NSI29989.1 DNA polymerase [Mediterraneibacter gnavus]NSI45793.1 DNA polymerase [Mediterraneibacter gnavus]NSI49338.1 DNA polymerase [Mediterraneibacter gnavus]